jgi:hypothetical protein
LEVVKVLEGASASLKHNGAMVSLNDQTAKQNGAAWSNRDVPLQRFDIELGSMAKPVAAPGRAQTVAH